jgi:hypothetical protein
MPQRTFLFVLMAGSQMIWAHNVRSKQTWQAMHT